MLLAANLVELKRWLLLLKSCQCRGVVAITKKEQKVSSPVARHPIHLLYI